MRDKKSTLILTAFIALQLIVAIALFAGPTGKKPEPRTIEAVEETNKETANQEEVRKEESENNTQVVSEPVAYQPQEDVIVEEIPAEPAPVEEVTNSTE